ncbi:hypothetical protein [Lactobacillus delbrueckii]|uniref:hypothetical protein n=1 Tax=Lactobacillus delbrueckii TaxID=1584 RepID=UPI001E5D6DAC|nr:hypothetical protein [Lactobacillus delbrueckii subsp. lactis]
MISQEVGSPWLVRSVADHFYALIPDSKVDQAIRNVHDAIIGDEAFGASIRAGIYPLSASDQQVSFAMGRARIAANNAVGNYQNYYCLYEQKMEADLTLANYLTCWAISTRQWLRAGSRSTTSRSWTPSVPRSALMKPWPAGLTPSTVF